MTTTDELKEQLRVAKEKLTARRRPRAELYSADVRVWEMKLRLALEHNLELEQRLAWEIKQRNVAEKYIQHQIRHLHSMLEAVIESSPNSSPRRAKERVESIPKPTSYVPAHHNYVPPPHNLSPLLTEVMQVQLKFAETMQQLDQSVHAREKLLHSPMNKAQYRRNRPSRVDTFTSYSSDSDQTSVCMETFTEALDREDTPSPIREKYQKPPTMVSTCALQMLTSSQHRDASMLMSPPPLTASMHLVQSRHIDENLTTPEIHRSIHFQDCDDDDTSPQHNYTPCSPSGSISSQPSTSLYSMCPSSDLDRSSFIADFAQFRQSMCPSAQDIPPKEVPQSPSKWTIDSQMTLEQLNHMKQQLSLDVQSLSAELTLLALDPSQSSPGHVGQLQNAVEDCRQRMQDIDKRMRALA
ncbi:hypothetical protein THRCLA_21655 [Thraustotheca clavata]|uniref:Uncharacterized protein n=1 Tax=Thraustotheca clavata TaxID=74557 RepID=A0A1V9ZRY6_9STRA|nr:hypothetical protein THRCLA_21655 [Thraustotheca clavata]